MFIVTDIEFSCPNLQRLIFGSTLKFSRCKIQYYQGTFNPKRLPKLVNLSLDIDSISMVSTRVLANILPQLETLALSDRHYRLVKHSRSTELLTQARNLKHLALPIAFDANSLVEDQNFKVSLETLHLPIQVQPRLTVELVWRDSTRTRLVDSLKGRRKNVKIDKVVIYGSKEEVIERWPGIQLDLFEWREDWRSLIVEEFDGR